MCAFIGRSVIATTDSYTIQHNPYKSNAPASWAVGDARPYEKCISLSGDHRSPLRITHTIPTLLTHTIPTLQANALVRPYDFSNTQHHPTNPHTTQQTHPSYKSTPPKHPQKNKNIATIKRRCFFKSLWIAVARNNQILSTPCTRSARHSMRI